MASELPGWASFLPQQEQQPLPQPEQPYTDKVTGERCCSDEDEVSTTVTTVSSTDSLGSSSCASSPPRCTSGQSLVTSAAGVLGNVWHLSRNAQGCRFVQEVLDTCSPDVQLRMALELKGHVREALRCPHANHVVQKLVSVLQPTDVQFVVDELASTGRMLVSQFARHRFGCRVLERLLERCSAQQVQPLVQEVLQDAVALAAHAYGNYVLQHVLEHGSAACIRELSASLGAHVGTLGHDPYASAVVAKALARGPMDVRLELACKLHACPGLLLAMARTRHGHLAARQVLELLEARPQLRDEACRELQADARNLRKSRSGRFVLASMVGGSARGAA